MTKDELEQLSREAAACLLKDLRCSIEVWPNGLMPRRGLWLHESTEACTEIMVKVLWPAGWVIQSQGDDGCSAWRKGSGGEGSFEVWYEDCGDDPMLAVRICELKALITMGKDSHDPQ